MAFHLATSITNVHDHRDELVYLQPVMALFTGRHSPSKFTAKLTLLTADRNAHYRLKSADFTNLDRLVSFDENESEVGHFDSTIPGCDGVGLWR